MYVATLQKSPERNMIRGVPPPPFRSDSHVAHKSSFSIVGTHDSRRKFDLIVYFADYPQKDFSATKKWRITESSGRWRGESKVENLNTFGVDSL
jgi:hypothetical protein